MMVDASYYSPINQEWESMVALPIDPGKRARAPFFRFADTVGDGTGIKNLNINATGGQLCKLTAQLGEKLSVARLIVLIEDAPNMSADEYGNLGAPLTNGISIYKTDEEGTKVHEITDPDTPIVSNMTWSMYNYDVTSLAFGAGNDAVKVRWTFLKAGFPIELFPEQSLVVDLADDFTGLARHYFQFQGQRRVR